MAKAGRNPVESAGTAYSISCRAVDRVSSKKHNSVEKRLQERTAYLDALIANSPVAIVVLDSRHRVQMCNRAFERLFLWKQSELSNVNVDRLIAQRKLRSEAVGITRRVLSGKKVHAISRRVRKDGTEVDVEIYGVPLMVDGKLRGVYGLYQDISQRRRSEEALRQLSARLLTLQDQERRRIARELHDATAQTLTGLAMKLNQVRASGRLSGEADRAVAESLELAEACMREIRTTSYLLHPPLLDEIGLESALAWYVDGFSRRSGVKVRLTLPANPRRFPRDIETTLFRVVQESLTNVHRHSGSPVAAVHLTTKSNLITLEVVDNGRGMPRMNRLKQNGIPGLGVGILGMQERLSQLGGELRILSRSNGTRIVATVHMAGGQA